MLTETLERIESSLIDPITKLSRDLKEAAKTMSPDEARFLVDYYYILQKQRIRTGNQIRSMSEEPHMLIQWLEGNVAVLERNVKTGLQSYAGSKLQGEWALSQHGIGPVITAGLLAHIDMTKTPSVSALWSFAGLNPNAKWEKKSKRPWNARLKVLCWHAGECFKRTSGSENSFYGKIYRKRKELEVERNEAGANEQTAKDTLEAKNFKRDTNALAAYSQGKLPAGRLDLRATRYATKLFLSHFWQVSYEVEFEKKPPAPWIIANGGHVDLIPAPNWPLV